MKRHRAIVIVGAIVTVAVLSGCAKPDLRIIELQVIECNEDDDYIKYSYVIENRDHRSINRMSDSINHKFTVQAWTSHDGTLPDGPFSLTDYEAAGGHVVGLQPDFLLTPGETISGNGSWSGRGTADRDMINLENRPYLVLIVDKDDEISEWSEDNNTKAVLIAP